MDELASPRLRPRSSAGAAASSQNARVDTAAASSSAANSASGAMSAAAPPDNKRRRRCNPLGVSAYQEKHLPATHTNFMLNETGWRADREEHVRRHDLGRTAVSASRVSIDVEIDEDGEMHEMDADMDTETPRRKLGPGLSFARRGAIHRLFVNTFGSPPEDSWGGRDGVAALIRHRLDIPPDSYRMVFRALEDIAACEKANAVYDPSGDAAFSGRKALVRSGSREEGIIANALASGIGVAQAAVLVNLDRERRQQPPVSYSAVQRYQGSSSAIDMHKRSTKKSGLGDPESIWAKVIACECAAFGGCAPPRCARSHVAGV